jgi:2-oxoglutarate ferredoxin oxidoreductase subunit delta
MFIFLENRHGPMGPGIARPSKPHVEIRRHRRTEDLKGYITIDRELCKECHLCIQACKKGLIVPSHEYNSRGYRPVHFNKEAEECTGCTLCAIACPDIAIEVYRE